jgi:hypothetical protein
MRWADRLIGLLSTIILARLLVPEDFGLIVMGSMVIAFVDVFFDFGVHVARAILPGFQPIHFGHGEPRLGGTRVFELPRKLGLRTDVTGPRDINPLPHPLS